MREIPSVRTDLAVEARELRRENAAETDALPGVEAEERSERGFPVTILRVLDENGSKELCKPVGSYVTVAFDALLRREEASFPAAASVLAGHMRALLHLSTGDSVLVVGLGNSAITPDAVGPCALDAVLVTRHLKSRMPQAFGAFREVSVLRAGVLGTTGMESADLVAAVAQKLKPDRIIAVDALAARNAERLCRTVQLSDAGIVPGSGVGNRRSSLSAASLGVPVLAVGVPTVVDAATLASEYGADPEKASRAAEMIVTPRDIDRAVHDAGRLIGYAIDLALHDGLTVEDVDMFL